MPLEKIKRGPNNDEKQRDIEIDPEVEGLDLTESNRESIIDTVKNSEKTASERERRPNSNFDQKGKHKSKSIDAKPKDGES